jgi:transposase
MVARQWISLEDGNLQSLKPRAPIPGIGPILATAIVAAIGSGAGFRKGRNFAARLGLVPRQHSTGGKAKLLGSVNAATFTCAREDEGFFEVVACCVFS